MYKYKAHSHTVKHTASCTNKIYTFVSYGQIVAIRNSKNNSKIMKFIGLTALNGLLPLHVHLEPSSHWCMWVELGGAPGDPDRIWSQGLKRH